MKTDDLRANNAMCPVEEIAIGECFTMSASVYIALRHPTNGDKNCFNITDNRFASSFPKNYQVTPINTTLLIETY